MPEKEVEKDEEPKVIVGTLNTVLPPISPLKMVERFSERAEEDEDNGR